MTKECFGVFMDFFDEEVRLKSGEKRVLMIADGATNHQSSLIKSKRIELKKLPTACPELNPAERFFEQLRTELSNNVFENMEDVELFLTEILKKYFENPKMVH